MREELIPLLVTDLEKDMFVNGAGKETEWISSNPIHHTIGEAMDL